MQRKNKQLNQSYYVVYDINYNNFYNFFVNLKEYRFLENYLFDNKLANYARAILVSLFEISLRIHKNNNIETILLDRTILKKD